MCNNGFDFGFYNLNYHFLDHVADVTHIFVALYALDCGL